MTNWIIELIGWIASLLIVGAYYFNMSGRWQSTDKLYIWFNLVGGIFFIINTWYHQAYPSALVNLVWVLIAANGIVKGWRKQ